MFKVIMVTNDNNYADRLKDFWNKNCGNEIELIVKKKLEKYEEETDLIICDEKICLSNVNCKTMTLVSEFETKDNDNEFPKYGKPKELYNKIIDICISENNEYANLDLRPLKIGNETILAFKNNQSIVDDYSLEIIRKCPIDGLIPLYNGNEKKEEIYYYIHGKISLKEYYSKHSSSNKILHILFDILMTLNKMDEYMLDRNNIVFDVEQIYIHQITGKPSLLFIPYKRTVTNNWEKSFRKLLIALSDISNESKEDEKYIDIKISDDKREKILIREQLSFNDRTEYFQSMQKISGTNTVEIKTARLLWKKSDKTIEIDRKIFKIGKEEKYVDFCIKDNPAVSRNHADILLQDGKVYIVDKASLNHTYINGQELLPNEKVELHNEDKIQIANESFIIYI